MSATREASPPSSHLNFFFLNLATDWFIIISYISCFWSSLQYKLNFFSASEVSAEKQKTGFMFPVHQEDDDGELCKEDVEMVMEKLGIFCSPEEENKLPEKLGSDEISALFEEKEPSLEEVKEAFGVFDMNGDGFIDAGELQRVLCILGLGEGLEARDCSKMIKVFDVNGDGRIDVDEFVNFL